MKHAAAIALAFVISLFMPRAILADGKPLMLGLIADGPYRTALALRIAHGVDHVDNLRVLPVIGTSPAQNLADLVELRGIDLALVPSDTLAFMRGENLGTAANGKIDYLVKLANMDVALLAGAAVQSLASLNGKRLAIGSATHASYETSLTLIRALKLDVTVLPLNGDDAIAAVQDGSADAAILVGVSPLPELARLKPGSGLHLVAIPPGPALDEFYAPSLLTAKIYPGLLKPEESVETISSSLVIAALRWPKGSPQQQHLAVFAKALFAGLTQGGEEAGINLNSGVAGWTRSPAAAAALESLAKINTPVPATTQEN